MVGISNKVIVKSKKQWVLHARLMILFNVHQKTIETWIEDRDPRLSNPTAVKIISEVLKIPIDQVLEEEPAPTTK